MARQGGDALFGQTLLRHKRALPVALTHNDHALEIMISGDCRFAATGYGADNGCGPGGYIAGGEYGLPGRGYAIFKDNYSMLKLKISNVIKNS